MDWKRLCVAQRIVPFIHQRLVFLFPDPVYRLDDIPHDVETVKHNLVICPRDILTAGIDESRPYDKNNI